MITNFQRGLAKTSVGSPRFSQKARKRLAAGIAVAAGVFFLWSSPNFIFGVTAVVVAGVIVWAALQLRRSR